MDDKINSQSNFEFVEITNKAKGGDINSFGRQQNKILKEFDELHELQMCLAEKQLNLHQEHIKNKQNLDSKEKIQKKQENFFESSSFSEEEGRKKEELIRNLAKDLKSMCNQIDHFAQKISQN